MELQVNHREKYSPLPTKEPKPNAFSANSFDPQLEENTTTELSETKTPIADLYNKWSPFIHFMLWMLTMAIIASYGYDSKYGTLTDALERREDQTKQMEYNTGVIKDKIAENMKIRNEVLSDNEMMVEAIREAMKVKEAKVVSSQP